jgi:hypothetical protein
MSELQSVFPIYLPRRRSEDETAEEYDTAVAQNENLLNQNFTLLFNQITNLTALVESQRAALKQQSYLIEALQRR